MKKLNFLGIILIAFLMMSCDKELFYDYIVENKSSESIHIHIEYLNSDIVDTTLGKKTILKIGTSIGYGTSVYEFELSSLYNYFEIQDEDSILSKRDYLLNKNWVYKEYSDTHAEYLLIVDSTHFE